MQFWAHAVVRNTFIFVRYRLQLHRLWWCLAPRGCSPVQDVLHVVRVVRNSNHISFSWMMSRDIVSCACNSLCDNHQGCSLEPSSRRLSVAYVGHPFHVASVQLHLGRSTYIDVECIQRTSEPVCYCCEVCVCFVQLLHQLHPPSGGNFPQSS